MHTHTKDAHASNLYTNLSSKTLKYGSQEKYDALHGHMLIEMLAGGRIFCVLEDYVGITGLLLCLSSIIFSPTYLFNVERNSYHVNCYYNMVNKTAIYIALYATTKTSFEAFMLA